MKDPDEDRQDEQGAAPDPGVVQHGLPHGGEENRGSRSHAGSLRQGGKIVATNVSSVRIRAHRVKAMARPELLLAGYADPAGATSLGKLGLPPWPVADIRPPSVPP